MKITRAHLGEIGDDETIDSVMATCDFAGGDYALRYIPPHLHIFRVTEREGT